MAIDFPTSPTVGQQVTSGSRTWSWSGSHWTNNTITGVQGIQGIQGVQGTQGTQGLQGITGASILGLNNTFTGVNSININGTVGATTPSTIAATSGTFSGTISHTSAAAYSPQFIQFNSTNDTSAPYHIFQKIRGSSIVQAGDTLGTVLFQGYDGTAYDNAAYIAGRVAAVTGSIVSGELLFVVTDSSGSTSTRAIITSTGLNSTAIGATTASTGAFSTLSATGITSITNSTASTSTTTGALKVTGGLGVAGAAFIGGTITSTGNISTTGGDVLIRGAAGGQITQNSGAGGLYIANTGTSTTMRLLVTNGAAASVTALTLAADSGNATFAGTLSATGNTITFGTDNLTLTDTYFGYSGNTYKVLRVGTVAASRSVALCVDPSAVTGGSFSGTGQILIGNNSMLAPNAAGTDWIGVLRATSGTVVIGPSTTSGELVGGVAGTATFSTTGLAVTGALSATGKVSSGGSGSGSSRLGAGYVTVNTSAVTIYTLYDNTSGGLLLVVGDNGSVGFSDLILFSLTQTPVVISSNNSYGSPAARTYSSTANACKCALASGSLTVRSVCIEIAG